jgi:hypothetical protein
MFLIFARSYIELYRYGYINGSPTDGNLPKNVKQLRKMIAELLLKIQNGKDGIEEENAKMFK